MPRGAGIPWDQPGATPLDDIKDVIEQAHRAGMEEPVHVTGGSPEVRAFLEQLLNEPDVRQRMYEWQEYAMKRYLHGDQLVDILKEYSASHGPVLGASAVEAFMDEAADLDVDLSCRPAGGRWLDFVIGGLE